MHAHPIYSVHRSVWASELLDRLDGRVGTVLDVLDVGAVNVELFVLL
jgi:hypothetical protein